jgi:predicted metal-dependent hydrolase
MLTKVYYFENIGEVAFQKTGRSANIRITVKPDQGVKVTFPNHVSLIKAYRFVEDKSEWIKKSLERLKIYEKQQTLFIPGTEYRTNEHRLEFFIHNAEAIKVRVANGLIKVFYASAQQLNSDSAQQIIRKGIIQALKIEAKKILPERLSYLAIHHGLKYTEISIKNMKSRWGSCTSANKINLNIHLIRLPLHLMDYVILHELAHTVQKNHGKHFWLLLDKLSGNAKALAKEMKEYRTQVF